MFNLFPKRRKPHDPAWDYRTPEWKSTRANSTAAPTMEPKGLGAVIRDANGDTWTRADRGTLPWFLTRADGNGGATTWGRWGLDFVPMDVLSHGVPVYQDNV